MIQTKQLIKDFCNIITLPHVALRITELVSSETSTIRQVEETLSQDPVLVARLMKLVNSAFYARGGEIDTIPRAIVCIGMAELSNLVWAASLRRVFLESEVEGVFSRKKLWVHSIAVAVIARMVSQRLYSRSGEDAFLAGMLHDTGIILEDQLLDKQFVKVVKTYLEGDVPLVDCEQKVIGTDHCELGFLLAKEWKFPENIRVIIREHHQSIENEQQMSGLLGVIQLAHCLAHFLGYTEFEDKVDPPKGLVSDFIEKHEKRLQVLLDDIEVEMKKSKVLFEDS